MPALWGGHIGTEGTPGVADRPPSASLSPTKCRWVCMGLHNGPSSLGRPHRRAKTQLPPPSGPCPYCGLPMLPGEKLDADHEVPRVFGGGGGPLGARSSVSRRRG